MLKVKARARHAFTLNKRIYFNRLQHACNLASLAISFVSEDTLETIKREQVEQRSVLKFSNKSSVRKSTTHFQCAQKHARCVIYKLNEFPLQKGTVSDYERHPFLVTIEKQKVCCLKSINSERWDLLDLWVELYQHCKIKVLCRNVY